MADVGFDGMAGDDEDLRAAWRDRLQREGKLAGGGSVRTWCSGPPSPPEAGEAGGKESAGWIIRRPSVS